MTDTTDCVFCRIVSGEIPCARLLDDPLCMAFLDVAPIAEGHALLIPKVHYDRLPDVPPDTLAALVAHLPRIAQALLRVTGAHGFNVLQNNGEAAGQVVPHVHFHIIPRTPDDSLGFRWPAGSYPQGRADSLRREIAAALGDAP